MSGPWRTPAAETNDYPNLWVHDGRVSGSITVGQSRLPLWAFSTEAILHGWDTVEASYEPTAHYGFTAGDFAGFVFHLLNVRGEFARLLLALADAERHEDDRTDAVLDATGEAVVDVTPGREGAVVLPPSWWEDPQLAAPVIDALRRCLDCLQGEAP